MTESQIEQPTSGSTVDLESLVNEFEKGIDNPTGEGGVSWLDARTTLEAEREHLTTAQAERLTKADRKLIANSGDIALKMEEAGQSLAVVRQNTQRSPEQWWWFLDVLDSVADFYSGKPPSPIEQRLSRVIDLLLLAALVVLGFLLIRNYVPGLFSGGPTATFTPFPSLTPAPTQTIDAAAFDVANAKVFKTTNDILEINLPAGWENTPSPVPTSYQFGYGSGTASQVTISINMDIPSEAYKGFQLPTTPKDPQDALTQFKTALAANPGLTMEDVRPVQLAKLSSAFGLIVHIQADPTQGSPAGEAEVWAGALSDGRVITITFQGGQTIWPSAKPAVYAMLAGMVVNIQNVPTVTPTATLHPLLITATALQTQILALTPTNTPVATGPATGVATDSGTAVATPAATSVPTGVVTAASTPAQ